jgi:hypothetical protein
MTATEELRRLLDDRGVEWWPMHDVEVGYRQDRDTEFLVHGCKHVAHEWGCRLQVDMLTPEQAIAATLGRGTIEKAAERIEVLSGLAREYLHRYGMLMSMAGEDVTDEVLAIESVINEVCEKKVVDA